MAYVLATTKAGFRSGEGELQISKQVRVGVWNYLLVSEHNENLHQRWSVRRVKVDGDGEGKYVEVYGPFDTPDQAMEAADFPKPKTEVEELWEVIDQVKPQLHELRLTTCSNNRYSKVFEIEKRIEELEAKWKK